MNAKNLREAKVITFFRVQQGSKGNKTKKTGIQAILIHLYPGLYQRLRLSLKAGKTYP